MAKLQKVGVLFFAKLQVVIFGMAGLVTGILYAGIGAIYDALTIGLNGGTALAFLAIIGMPLMSAAVGFIAGAIGAVLYNQFARWFGGIESGFDESA